MKHLNSLALECVRRPSGLCNLPPKIDELNKNKGSMISVFGSKHSMDAR
jgi:hypothetical protein